MPDDLQHAIAAELGIENLSSEEQQEVVARMSGVLLKAATIAVLEALPEEKRQAFMDLAEAGDQEGIKAYLAKELPESENIVRTAIAEEVRRFNEYQQSITA